MTSLSFGEMGMVPRVFWRMTLAEWRAAVDGFVETRNRRMRELAWGVSHLLIAAGCEADKVSPANLLGEEEPKVRQRRQKSKAEIAEDIWNRIKPEEDE